MRIRDRMTGGLSRSLCQQVTGHMGILDITLSNDNLK